MSHQHHYNSSGNTTDPNIMFVQADPSSFRDIVQTLTGAPPDISSSSSGLKKLRLTPKKHAFKLHERRQSSKKMELNLNNMNVTNTNDSLRHFIVSPVSHLDPYWARVSPHSARDDKEETKAIAEKGFFFHLSPISGGDEPAPELLPLFPLCSPKRH